MEKAVIKLQFWTRLQYIPNTPKNEQGCFKTRSVLKQPRFWQKTSLKIMKKNRGREPPYFFNLGRKTSKNL
jgi:hypothetical protein